MATTKVKLTNVTTQAGPGNRAYGKWRYGAISTANNALLEAIYADTLQEFVLANDYTVGQNYSFFIQRRDAADALISEVALTLTVPNPPAGSDVVPLSFAVAAA